MTLIRSKNARMLFRCRHPEQTQQCTGYGSGDELCNEHKLPFKRLGVLPSYWDEMQEQIDNKSIDATECLRRQKVIITKMIRSSS